MSEAPAAIDTVAAAPGPASEAVPVTPPAASVRSGPAEPDIRPSALQQPRPFYPRIARQRGWQGVVVLRVAVDERGHPCEVGVQTSSGHPVLDEAALEAVRQWRFAPARLAGLAIASTVDVPVRFSLTES